MSAKEYLNNIRLQWKEIEILRDRIESLDSSILPNAIAYNRYRVQTSRSNVSEDKITTLINYKRELGNMALRFVEDHRKAQRMINTLDDTRERQALEVYYLSIPPRSIEKTALEINYSVAHVYRLIDSGIAALERHEDNAQNE